MDSDPATRIYQAGSDLISGRRGLPRTAAAFIGVSLAAAIMLGSASRAAASLRIANVDASGQPSVRLTVVMSESTTRAPRVTEDGQAVAHLTAANLGYAKNVVLAVDRSQSMRGQALRDATEAAIRFVALKPSDDQIKVVTFSSDTLFQTQFTSAPSESESALRGITDDPRYGTTLYDAIVRSAKSLANAGAPGRVIVLVTDGQETTSHATLAQAIGAARKAHALVYPIAIESNAFSPGPLKQLARRTGGSYYRARSSADLARIYEHISHELRRTWRLEYLTAARPGDRLRLQVSEGSLGSAATAVRLPGSQQVSPSQGLPIVLVAFGSLLLAVLCALLARPLLEGGRSLAQRGNEDDLY
jgi:VWFA-related protein